MAEQYYEGVGRRKEASARVRIIKGAGTFTVNGKPMEDYFTRETDNRSVSLPLEATHQDRSLCDISAIVNGGGITGQTSAVRLGLARALLSMNEAFRPHLRKAGLLSRDARIKERKKPGLKRARKAPTYTKR